MGKLISRFTPLYFLFLVVHMCALSAESTATSADSNDKKGTEDKKATEVPPLTKKEITTTHSVKINNIDISYTATIGTQPILDEKGKPKANFVYIAYTKNNTDQLQDRPIAFCFNGGPGSSSVWLHLGTLGPKRIEFDSEGLHPKQPSRLIDNSHSLLDVADLVFLDPVSTGYTRAENSDDAKQYHGVDGDIQSVAEFIRLYVTRNQRWGSPKFLIGESYGTVRAVGVAEELHDKKYLYLNGLILISSVLNYETLMFDSGNDLPYILFLPSYTVAALYHNKLEDSLKHDPEKTIREAKEFAYGEYAKALLKGSLLDKDERQAVVDKMSKYTGLSQQFVDSANLRVNGWRFAKELLKSEKKTIGRFDSRFVGPNLDQWNSTDYDPSFENVLGVFTSSLNQYLQSDLQWDSQEEYKILTDVSPWDYDSKNQYLDMTENLRHTMIKNPKLQVFVVNGINDLALPFVLQEYTFAHLNLPPELRQNVAVKTYEGGHMMYLKQPTLGKMKEDMAKFIEQSSPHR